MRQKPVVLCILDGWGYSSQAQGNAIELGNTPYWHNLLKEYPSSFIKTSGLAVGLPDGQMGNSEVGHTNLGAGRVVMQDLPKIDQSIETGTLKTNPVLQTLITKLKQSKGTCHLMGLLGDGGVHAHQNHLIALCRILNESGIPVSVHAFTDGRDTPPDSAVNFIQGFLNNIADCPLVKLGTLGGRYYAMDRDNRWDRVQKAYDAIVEGQGPHYATAIEAISSSYEAHIFDEFIVPCIIGDYSGMADRDGLIFANFRSDRAREITRMLLDPHFDFTSRGKVIHFTEAVSMTDYSSEHTQWLHSLFPSESLTHIFGEVISQAGLTQLRIAETEKYAHVTFFFNGGEEKLFKGEERILVPSPKVATYDLKPEMSAFEVTDKLVSAIQGDKFDVIIVNYANGDMVGHTGIMTAALKAVETVDTCLGRLAKLIQEKEGILLVTADHGNAEKMLDEDGKTPFTAHTNGVVKAVLMNAKGVKSLKDGKLADIAPTLLDLLGLPKPSEMTGNSLIER